MALRQSIKMALPSEYVYAIGLLRWEICIMLSKKQDVYVEIGKSNDKGNYLMYVISRNM